MPETEHHPKLGGVRQFSVMRLARPQLRDPGDEMVLEAAVNGRADFLVTFNVPAFGTVPSRFGIEVMIPRDVLGRIRQ